LEARELEGWEALQAGKLKTSIGHGYTWMHTDKKVYILSKKNLR
jgi:hypothetical protein